MGTLLLIFGGLLVFWLVNRSASMRQQAFTQLNSGLVALGEELDRRFAEIDRRLTDVESRLDSLERRTRS